MSERILLTVDGSEASARSVEYVARTVAERPDQYVHLMHVVASEGAVSREHTAAEVEAEARVLLGTMREQLVLAGIQDEHIDTGILTVPSLGDLVQGVLDAATDQRCGTIVVGRSSLSWLQEAFHEHLADELLKAGQGFTVWVVQ